MRIGLSFSRCVRDIVEGKVDIDDVLVIIARTNFDPTVYEDWAEIWEGYGGGTHFGNAWLNPEWSGLMDEDLVRDITLQLWNQGKIHQPRKFGANLQRLEYYWLEATLPSEELESNPSINRAWENFKIVAGLASPKKIFKDI